MRSKRKATLALPPLLMYSPLLLSPEKIHLLQGMPKVSYMGWPAELVPNPEAAVYFFVSDLYTL